jgi:hypothetical protein
MFQPNRSSSGVQLAVMKEPAAHCNVVLLFLHTEEHCSQQQFLSSQQTLHLMMANESETYSDGEEKTTREY